MVIVGGVYSFSGLSVFVRLWCSLLFFGPGTVISVAGIKMLELLIESRK